jgi:hypothetical protein
MADDDKLQAINEEFALYIRSIPRKDTSKDEIDDLKEHLRAILGQYQDLIPPP